MAATNFMWEHYNNSRMRNISGILMLLIHEETVYRVNLAEKLDLSATTITNLTDELIQQGLIVERESPESDSEVEKRRGRPRTGLNLVKNARYALGVHIGVGTYHLALVNLCAQIKESSEGNFDVSLSPEELMEQIAADLERLIIHSGVDRGLILGAGVGIAGLVGVKAGVSVFSQNLGWKNVPIKQELEGRLNLPVVVDNVVRGMALGEWMFGLGRGQRSLAFVNGATGVGAGLIMDGKLLRGSTYGAGELGHFSMLPEIGDLCRCGKRGCLETLVSTQVLCAQSLKMANAHPESKLAQLYLAAQTDDDDRLQAIFQAARQADPWAAGIVDQSAFYLGIALANLVNLFNPEMILLGGIFSQAQDLYLAKAQKTMRENAYAGIGDHVRLISTGFGELSGVIGASALALLSLFYRPFNDD